MRYLQLLAVLLLAMVWGVAQDYPSQTNSAQASHATPVNAGGEQSVQGCLSGADGNYSLMVKNGTSFRLAGDTAKLAEHIGHEIKVTGIMNSASTSPNTDTSAGTTGQSTPSSGGEIQVTAVKHIAKTCQTGISH
jgi:hypothetical protein